MGKKFMNMFFFLAVLGASVFMTVFTGRGSTSTMIYNFVFLGIMAILYLVGMFAGMFRLHNISDALDQGTDGLVEIFKNPGRVKKENLSCLQGIFENKYLDERMDSFVESVDQSREGMGDIEEYISEDDIDLHIHKRLLEMLPDIFTSLGILGTFVGLVWGLKNFEPSSYETMTNSVSTLVEGIKVAFLTSIYGIAMAIIFNSGMKSAYSEMSENLQRFLEKFHAYVIPTAESESRNLLIASQKIQTKAMKQMVEEFYVQMAGSFEKVITPTFQKMNDSLDVLVDSVTRCQQDAVKEILDTFLAEMNNSFKIQFQDFNDALAQMEKTQKENIEYTSNLYRTMSQQLSESYVKQNNAMKNLVNELGNVQGRYMTTATRIAQDNQEIQKNQQQDYQRVTDYLREAERSSAKFWVACNQTMQKYVETAAQGMEKAAAANQVSAEVLKANKRVMDDLDSKMQDFVTYQKMTYQTMEQVRRIFSDISVAGDNRNIYLTGGQMNKSVSREEREALDQMRSMLKEQGERQEALLEEMSKNMKDFSKSAQKGKFSLFR
ncbi:MAG: MotA/TolQ/ExbB proton channel family protein [Blautia sp.]|nr:MotA/TolQ/ExbB proton channel family protein [Blautia sp.]